MARQTQWLFEVPVAWEGGRSINRYTNLEYSANSAYGLPAPHEIENAIQRNQVLRKNYCWEFYIPYIFEILESEGYLSKGYGKSVDYYTNSEDFVLAVAGWQEARGLEPDGKIGKNTWPEMWAQIRWIKSDLPQDACPKPKVKSGTQQVMTGEPDWVSWDPSPNHEPRMANGKKVDVTTIVYHYTAGASLERAVEGFKRPKALSAHYVIGKDGTTVQMVSLDRVAIHADGKTNLTSIGIEIVNLGFLHTKGQTWKRGKEENKITYTCNHLFCNDYGNPYQGKPVKCNKKYWDPFTDAQYDSLIDLTQYLLSRFPAIKRVIGHQEVSTTGKVDPGDAFDWQRIWNAIGSGFSGRIGPTKDKPIPICSATQ